MDEMVKITEKDIYKSVEDSQLGKLLEKDEIGNLIETCSLKQFREGSNILLNTYIAGAIYIIIHGRARAIDTLPDRFASVEVLGCGEIFGLASIMNKAPIEEVISSTNLLVLEIKESTLIELMQNKTDILKKLRNSISSIERWEIVKHLSGSGHDLSQTNYKNKKLEIFVLNDADLTDNEKYKYVTIKGKGEVREANSQELESKEQKVFYYDKNYESIYCKEARVEIPDIADEKTTDPKPTINTIEPSRANKIIQNIDENDIYYDYTEKGKARTILRMICKIHNIAFRSDNMNKKIDLVSRADSEISLEGYARIIASLGLNAAIGKIDSETVARVQIPSIIEWKGEKVIITGIAGQQIRIASPTFGRGVINLKGDQRDNFEPTEVLVTARRPDSPTKRLDLNWFIPTVKKYTNELTLVLVASLFVQLFTLANPLIIQVIIDKVITQRSLDTLQVLGWALIIAALVEAMLSGFRSILFNDVTNKIDVALGAEVIDHLFKLPLSYFDKRPVGELGTRIAEIEKIRSFITGQALTTIIDAFFSIIYVIIMAMYSPLLTFVALGILPIQVSLTILGAPVFRKQYRSTAEANAKTQSYLVEILSGIQTVKAQNVEEPTRWKWQKLYSDYVQRAFEKNTTGVVIIQFSQTLQRISQLLILWIGASLVLKGEFSLGQLIAFRIISNYVTQPVMRLSTIWQSIQELKVSFERLGDIIDTEVESPQSRQDDVVMPGIKGDIKMKNINFTFSQNSELVLKSINLEVKSGEFVGIVGQSGSGKSTLTKLISRLYNPTSGELLIDNLNNTKVELYSLRSQIGIVPQEPLLFQGTIYDNIALANGSSTSDEVMEAAKCACAHEFIMKMPMGYSSLVGERGSALSGGQKQRIAIARTLLMKNKLIIFDEATSALDYDTEKRVCENIKVSLSESTVLFVTHRLQTIKNANLICMMKDGIIEEKGTHEQLMDKKGLYYALYKQQEFS